MNLEVSMVIQATWAGSELAHMGVAYRGGGTERRRVTIKSVERWDRLKPVTPPDFVRSHPSGQRMKKKTITNNGKHNPEWMCCSENMSHWKVLSNEINLTFNSCMIHFQCILGWKFWFPSCRKWLFSQYPRICYFAAEMYSIKWRYLFILVPQGSSGFTWWLSQAENPLDSKKWKCTTSLYSGIYFTAPRNGR